VAALGVTGKMSGGSEGGGVGGFSVSATSPSEPASSSVADFLATLDARWPTQTDNVKISMTDTEHASL